LNGQRIATIMWPIQGLDTEPDFPEELFIDGERLQLGLTYIVGKAPTGSALVEATSTGALKVADTGSGLETYEVNTGTSADAYAAGQTHETSSGWDEVRILVERNELFASFKNAAGTWGSDWALAIGEHRIVLSCYGVKFKSRTLASDGDYEMRGLS
jgi:hypothetical protein